jgi:CubicO group peptidase (beta-lactamase class C family)
MAKPLVVLAAIASTVAATPVPSIASVAPLSALHRARFLSANDPNCPIRPSAIPLPSPVPAPVAGALINAIDASEQLVNATSLPSCSIAVGQWDSVLAASAIGMANVSSATPATPTTLYRIGSVTKVFSALLLLQAASQGMLSLDDPVSKQVPEFSVINPYGQGLVTWRHLLSQRSGLQREAPAGLETTGEVLQALAETYLIEAPGGTPSYSNLGFSLIGNLVAERVAGSTFSKLVQEWVCSPLGLNNTGNEYTPNVMSRLAQPYAPNGEPYSFYDLGWSAPAGGMYSTPSDLTTVALALMQVAADGTGPFAGSIGQDIAREALDPTFWNPDGTTIFGMPWENRIIAPYLVRRKGGNLPGFTTYLSFVPELRTVIAATFNGGTDEFSAADASWNAILPGLVQGLTESSPSPFNPGPNPQQYTGVFTSNVTELTAYVLFNATGQGELLVDCPGVLSIYINDVSSILNRPDSFQTFYPDGLSPCLNMELLAAGKQYVFFTRDAHGAIATVSMPGFVPGAVFSKAS